MKEWLRETHGATFELLRHFLIHFFDNDLITTPGQMSKLLIAISPVCLQWFFLIVFPLHGKYAYLSELPTSAPYRVAVRADELWLITLMMSVIGLLTALKWQALFPDLSDYRALGALPLRSSQIFVAKLVSLLVAATAALVTINLLPCLVFPTVSEGHWATDSSLLSRVWAHAGASVAACTFSFFGLLALQGVLLNVLPPRTFTRVAANVQGFLVAVMLVLLIASFSIQPEITNAILGTHWARWIPPLWFLGLYEALTGQTDTSMQFLATRAEIGVAVAIPVALVGYFICYRRHRKLMVEGEVGSRRDRRCRAKLLDWVLRDPRKEAIVDFMAKGLMHSSYHRTIVMGYGGFGLAVFLTVCVAIARFLEPNRALAASFLYYHIIALTILLIGTRHLFSRPVEVKANWVFQITEGEGRAAWLGGIDSFVLFWGAILLLVVPFPFELWLLGWRGATEAILFAALGLMSYEWAFCSWEKLPFTCSHLPGKTPTWMILASLGLIGIVSLLHTILLAVLSSAVVYAVVVAALIVAWIRLHHLRRQTWAELRHLKYDEGPEPVVHTLSLLK